jgi:hypothetical protein
LNVESTGFAEMPLRYERKKDANGLEFFALYCIIFIFYIWQIGLKVNSPTIVSTE